MFKKLKNKIKTMLKNLKNKIKTMLKNLKNKIKNKLTKMLKDFFNFLLLLICFLFSLINFLVKLPTNLYYFLKLLKEGKIWPLNWWLRNENATLKFKIDYFWTMSSSDPTGLFPIFVAGVSYAVLVYGMNFYNNSIVRTPNFANVSNKKLFDILADSYNEIPNNEIPDILIEEPNFLFDYRPFDFDGRKHKLNEYLENQIKIKYLSNKILDSNMSHRYDIRDNAVRYLFLENPIYQSITNYWEALPKDVEYLQILKAKVAFAESLNKNFQLYENGPTVQIINDRIFLTLNGNTIDLDPSVCMLLEKRLRNSSFHSHDFKIELVVPGKRTFRGTTLAPELNEFVINKNIFCLNSLRFLEEDEVKKVKIYVKISENEDNIMQYLLHKVRANSIATLEVFDRYKDYIRNGGLYIHGVKFEGNDDEFKVLRNVVQRYGLRFRYNDTIGWLTIIENMRQSYLNHFIEDFNLIVGLEKVDAYEDHIHLTLKEKMELNKITLKNNLQNEEYFADVTNSQIFLRRRNNTIYTFDFMRDWKEAIKSPLAVTFAENYRAIDGLLHSVNWNNNNILYCVNIDEDYVAHLYDDKIGDPKKFFTDFTKNYEKNDFLVFAGNNRLNYLTSIVEKFTIEQIYTDLPFDEKEATFNVREREAIASQILLNDSLIPLVPVEPLLGRADNYLEAVESILEHLHDLTMEEFVRQKYFYKDNEYYQLAFSNKLVIASIIKTNSDLWFPAN